MPRLTRGAIPPDRFHAPRRRPTPQPDTTADQQQAEPQPSTWPQIIDSWLHEPPIRRTLLAAFIVTLTALVLLPLTGGPLALAAVFGPLSGGTGYAVWRSQRPRHRDRNKR